MSAFREAALLVAAGAGLGSLLLVGLPWPLVLAALSAALLSPWLRGAAAWVPPAPVALGLLGAFGLAALGGAPVAGLAGLLAGLLVLRLVTRHGVRDDRVAVLLSVLMLVLAGTLTREAAFAVPLLLWATAAPIGLLAGHLPDRARVGGWAPAGAGVVLLALGLSAAVFLIVPRWGAPPQPVARATAVTGFAPEVALGDMDVLFDDPTPVLRVRVEAVGDAAVPTPLRLRGAVLDAFDGRRWLHTTEPEPWAGLGQGDLRVQVIEESVVHNVLFTVGQPVRIDAPAARVLRDRDGALWAERPDRPLRYTVWSRGAWTADLDPDDRERLLQLPADLDPRVVALAAGIAPPGVGGLDAARAIRAWLNEQHTYTREPRDADVEGPLSAFLFERRSGHCEYFASALVVLLRARGVPARLVEGFAGGEYNEVGAYWLFRRSHAHAWGEVWSDGAWHEVDATPRQGAPAPPPATARWLDGVRALWAERVVGYDRGVQVSALVGLGRAVERRVRPDPLPAGPPWVGWAVLGLGVLAAILAGVRGIRRGLAALAGERPAPPSGRVASVHAATWDTLRRRGWDPPRALPPVAAARWLRTRAGEAAEPMERLAWLHYAVRYGGADDAVLAEEATSLAAAVAGAFPPR